MKINYLILLLACFSASIYAQNTTLSPYSYYGVGQPIVSRTVENNSIGGVTAYADSTQFSLDNPATLAKLKFIQYRVGADYRASKQQAQQSFESTSVASLRYLALSVPTKYFAFSFGLRPKSSVGYRIIVSDNLNGLEQQSAFSGTGGVNSTFFGIGFMPVDGLSLGFSANYNFGFTEKTILQSVSNVQLNSQLFTRSELSGAHYTFGAHYNKSIFSDYEVQLSATYTPNSALKSSNTRTLSTLTSSGSIGTQQDIDLKALANTSNNIAAETTIGISFGKPQKWFVGATYVNTNQGVTYPLESNPDVEYVANSRFSLGGFYIPKYDSFTNYFNRIVYRLGTRFEHTGLNLKKQDIKDFGITFGIGLPLSGLSKVNIGVEIGQLGTLDSGLVKENYTNIMLGFSLSDVWFIKRKYD